MRAKHLPALLAFVARALLAQTGPTAPLGTFDLNLAERAGAGSAVAFFVARDSHLYFATSGPGGSLVFVTDQDGVVQNTASLGPEPIVGFDVDAAGNVFALQGGSRLTEFDSEWNIKRTLNLAAPVVSLALVGGRPMGVGESRHVGYLDTDEHDRIFNPEEWPQPWFLFSFGADGIGIFCPGAQLGIARVDGDSQVTEFGRATSAHNSIAATAGPGDKIYLLESPGHTGSIAVSRYSETMKPEFLFDFAAPDGFHPRMIGVAGERIYLVDPAGKVVFYPLDASASRVMDSNPELLTDMESVREAARKAGYTGRIEVDLEVNREGLPQNIQIKGPLANVADVVKAVETWRFRPAIRSGKPATVRMEVGAVAE